MVQIYPKGQTKHDKNHISVFLHNNTNEDIYAKYVMSTNANKSEKILSPKRFYKTGSVSCSGWGWTQAFKQDEISLQPPNGTLTLIFEITILVKTQSIEFVDRKKSKAVAMSSNYHLKQLAQDFDSLLKLKQHTDVTVKCGEKLFDCHQNILASRSR